MINFYEFYNFAGITTYHKTILFDIQRRVEVNETGVFNLNDGNAGSNHVLR